MRRTDKKRKILKTSMCSFRIDHRFKEELQSIAQAEGRSLSSLIGIILKHYLQTQKRDLPLQSIAEDRRSYPRKEVLLPARWRIQRGEDIVEHDVLIKNISAGGAYTEYVNGDLYRIFESEQPLSLELVAKLPGSSLPVELKCEPMRFNIAEDRLGVGLRYTKIEKKAGQIVLNKFLIEEK